MLTKANELFL